MTDPTLPPVQPDKDKKNVQQPPLSETEKFEDIFKTIDIDADSNIDISYTTTTNTTSTQTSAPQSELSTQENATTENLVSKTDLHKNQSSEIDHVQITQLQPEKSLADVPTENPIPEVAITVQPQETQKNDIAKKIVQEAPPVEPELTGIKDIWNYIAKAKENQAQKVMRLEAEDGTDLTKLPGIYAVVPHIKGDHKLIYTYGSEPAWLIDDPKKRTPGTSYIKNNELIYDVWVTMKKHPTLKNERNEPLDVWLIDTPDQLTQQLASIAIGKWGGTNFSAPVICKKETPTPSSSPVGDSRGEGHRNKKVPTKPTPTPGAKATVSQSQPQPVINKKEVVHGLTPEAKKTIKDTMAQKEAGNTPPPSLSKNFPSKKTELPTVTSPTQKSFPNKERTPEVKFKEAGTKENTPKRQTPPVTPPPVKQPVGYTGVTEGVLEKNPWGKEPLKDTSVTPLPKNESPKPPVKATPQNIPTSKKESQLDIQSTPLPKNTPPKKPDLLPPLKQEIIPDIQVVVEEEKILPSTETEKLPNEITLTQATAETKEADSIQEQIISTTPPLNEIATEEVLIVPTEHKETYGDIVDLDSLDAQASPAPKEQATPSIDLGWLDAQFSPAAKKGGTSKKSWAPIGMILRIVGVLIVIWMARAMYTVMFPAVPTRPAPTDTTTGDVLPDKTPSIVDDTATWNTNWSSVTTSWTTGMPSKDDVEGANHTGTTGDTFTFDELKAKLTAQQKEAQTTANKAKLLNNKDAIKFSIVSIRKASDALKRIEEDPTITASELTDIATKIDLYLQEAQLRIQ